MVEGFVLPHRATPSRKLVECCGPKFPLSLSEFRQCEGPSFGISQCGEEKMDVVWHDDRRMKTDCLAMVVWAMLQGTAAGFGRQDDSPQRAKCNKQRAIVALIVGKAAAVLVAAEVALGNERTSNRS